jgi:hypothetical protein
VGKLQDFKHLFSKKKPIILSGIEKVKEKKILYITKTKNLQGMM